LEITNGVDPHQDHFFLEYHYSQLFYCWQEITNKIILKDLYNVLMNFLRILEVYWCIDIPIECIHLVFVYFIKASRLDVTSNFKHIDVPLLLITDSLYHTYYHTTWMFDDVCTLSLSIFNTYFLTLLYICQEFGKFHLWCGDITLLPMINKSYGYDDEPTYSWLQVLSNSLRNSDFSAMYWLFPF
jgi:hypothetical protein